MCWTKNMYQPGSNYIKNVSTRTTEVKETRILGQYKFKQSFT